MEQMLGKVNLDYCREKDKKRKQITKRTRKDKKDQNGCFSLINIFMSTEYLRKLLLKTMCDVCLGLQHSQIWNVMNFIIRSIQRWRLSKDHILNASPLMSTDYI